MAKQGDGSRPARPDDDATRGDDAPARAITRRRFVGLIAAGAGATLTPAAVAAAGTTRRKDGKGAATAKPPAAETLPPKVAKGLDEQRASLARTLKTLREFELPPGSEQGFAFRPLPARRNP